MEKLEHRATDRETMTRSLSATSVNKVTKGGSEPYDVRHANIVNDIISNIQILNAAIQRGKVDLNDPDEVRLQTESYLLSCADAGVIPSLLSLAPCLGYSRQYLYKWMSNHPDHETTRFIDLCRSSWSALIAHEAMMKNVEPITALFILKNGGQGLSSEPKDDVIHSDVKKCGGKSSEEIMAEFADLL